MHQSVCLESLHQRRPNPSQCIRTDNQNPLYSSTTEKYGQLPHVTFDPSEIFRDQNALISESISTMLEDYYSREVIFNRLPRRRKDFWKEEDFVSRKRRSILYFLKRFKVILVISFSCIRTYMYTYIPTYIHRYTRKT